MIRDRMSCCRYRLDEVQTALALLQGMADGAPAAGLSLGPALSPSAFLAGRLDMRCTAVGGHSYGGATAVATAATDARVRACVTLDPWWCARCVQWQRGAARSTFGLLQRACVCHLHSGLHCGAAQT